MNYRNYKNYSVCPPVGGGGEFQASGDAGNTRRLSKAYSTGYLPGPQDSPGVLSRLRGLRPLALHGGRASLRVDGDGMDRGGRRASGGALPDGADGEVWRI